MRSLRALALVATLAFARLAGAQAPQSISPGALARAACGDRRPCRVEEVLDAGADGEGRPLRVARVLLSPPSHPHADGSPAFDGECARFEWVLVSQDGSRLSARTLVEICNDGYGARGAGEDTVVVLENRFTHTRVGGSAWGWSETTTLSLSPLAVIARESGGWWSLGPNTESRSIHFATLTSSGSWWAPMCGPGGDPPFDAGAADEVRWVAIPRVSLGARELVALRDGASLGTCGARIDGMAPHGIVLEGAADPASASLRALWPLGGPLVVEIDDDLVTAADRLEIWVGGERPSYMDHCRDPSEVTPARGVSIALSDGAVAPGSTLFPSIERTASGSRVRISITLPDDVRAMTLVHADDDGAGVVRRIASSTLDVNDAATLGELETMPRATCVLDGGALRPTVDTRVHGGAPVVGP